MLLCVLVLDTGPADVPGEGLTVIVALSLAGTACVLWSLPISPVPLGVGGRRMLVGLLVVKAKLR